MSRLSSWLKKKAGIPETKLKVDPKAVGDLEERFVKQVMKLYGVPEVSARTLFRWLMKELGVATLLLLCLAGARATVIPFSSGADYLAKRATAQAGDVMQATQDFTFSAAQYVKGGVTVDLNGKTVTFTGRPKGWTMYSGSRLINGTVTGPVWGIVSWEGVDDIQVKKVDFKDITGAVFKLGANGTGVVNNVLIEDVTARMTGNTPASIADIGPAKSSNVVFRRCWLRGIDNPTNNTANDGIAVEDGSLLASGVPGVTIEDTTVESVGGDGIDCKGQATLRNVLVKDATRNGVKLWRGGWLEKVAVVHCGFGSLNVAPITATDCYFEAGYLGGTAWTSDYQGYYKPDAAFTRCAFTRKGLPGGLLMQGTTAGTLTYTDCTFWNGPVDKPYYPNVYIGKWSVVINAGKITPFPAAWVRPVYADREPPAGVGYAAPSEPPVDPPPPPPPPPVEYATKAEAEALRAAGDAMAGRVSELEAALAAIRAWLKGAPMS